MILLPLLLLIPMSVSAQPTTRPTSRPTAAPTVAPTATPAPTPTSTGRRVSGGSAGGAPPPIVEAPPARPPISDGPAGSPPVASGSGSSSGSGSASSSGSGTGSASSGNGAPTTGARAPGPAGSTSSAVVAAGGAPDGSIPFTSPSTRPCGQACLNERANENLYIQYLYLAFQNLALERATSDSEKAEILGTNCLTGESTSDCAARYIRLSVPQLLTIRRSILRNNQNIEALDTVMHPGPDGPTKAYAVEAAPDAAPLNANLPYVPTYEELAEHYRRQPQLTPAQLLAQYRTFAAQNTAQLNDPTLFATSTTTARNPERPSPNEFLESPNVAPGGGRANAVDSRVAGKVGQYSTDHRADYDDDRRRMLAETDVSRASPVRSPRMDATVVTDKQKDSYLKARSIITQLVRPRLEANPATGVGVVTFGRANSAHAPNGATLIDLSTARPDNQALTDKRTDRAQASNIFLSIDTSMINQEVMLIVDPNGTP